MGFLLPSIKTDEIPKPYSLTKIAANKLKSSSLGGLAEYRSLQKTRCLHSFVVSWVKILPPMGIVMAFPTTQLT
jgi:hypothetical protein